MKDWCSLNRNYHVSDYTKLRSLFESEFDMRTQIEDYEVRLKVTAYDFPVALGDDLLLCVELENVGRENIPPNTEVKIIENDYFDSTPIFFKDEISTNNSVSKKVKVPAKGEKKAILLPEILEFGISHKSVKLICKQSGVKLYSEFFIKDIIELKPPLKDIQYLNILCFGVAGSGKSSFINSLMTAINNRICTPAAVGGAENHVTTALTRFSIKDLEINEIEGFNTIPINLFDIWGMDADNYQNGMFLDVLKGKLPESFEMKDRTVQSQILKDAVWSQSERTIHSVIFFMPYNIEDNPLFTDALAENFRICTKDNKMNPVIVVTRASFEGESDAQNSLRMKISEKFNIPAGQIFMYDNYTHEGDKTMEIDRKTLQILAHTLNSAVYYQKFSKNYLLSLINNPPNTQIDTKQTSPVVSNKPITNQNTDGKYNKFPLQKTIISNIKDVHDIPRGRPPIIEPVAVLKCVPCGEPVESDWDECPACGRPLSRLCEPRCERCGTEVKSHWKQCPKCKFPIKTGAPIVPPKKYCWNSDCGKEVESDWDNCRGCDAYQIRPVTCCEITIKQNYFKCPRCKKLFPPLNQ